VTLPVWASWLLLAAVGLERLAELVLSRRNTQALLAAGAQEAGAGHYPFIVAVHVLWLAALAIWLASTDAPLALGWAAAFLAVQPLRVWVMNSLGRFWTTRIISLPGAPLVRRGPYRFLRHPNYAVVVAEVALLPLAFGAWQIAAVFSALNAAVLFVRIRTENEVLVVRF
jgi:methyltransferase